MSDEEDFDLVQAKEAVENKYLQDLLYKHEIENSLTDICYLPFLISNNYHGTTHNEGKREADKAKFLLDNIWNYLNPEQQPQVKRYFFYKLMKILMLNISKKSEIELQNKLAVFLIEVYKIKGIQLKQNQNTIQNEDELAISQKLNKSDFQSIEEESDTKIQKIFNQIKTGLDSVLVSADQKLNDVQIVNKYFQVYMKNCYTIQQFIKAFVHDHGCRFAYIQFNDTKKIYCPIIENCNPKTMNVIPKDSRKYKDHTIDNIVSVHTFTPRINPLTVEIAKKRDGNLLKIKRQLLNQEDDNLTFLDKYNFQMIE